MTVIVPRGALALVSVLVAVRLALDLLGVTADAEGAVGAGARDTDRVLGGEAWRLLTATALHATWLHLALAAVGLLLLGFLLEPSLGPLRFVLVFLASATAGHVLSMLSTPGVVSMGGSGGVYGLSGFLAARLLRGDSPFPGAVSPRLAGLALVVGLAAAGIRDLGLPGIDGFSHLGGLGAGFALGWPGRGAGPEGGT